jgi:hypothetical protein
MKSFREFLALRWTAAGVAVAIVASASSSRAADPTMSECLAANESSIALRGDHKLRSARDQALVCSAVTCPAEVRDVCQTRLHVLSAAIPTVVFLATDPAGHVVVDVHVTMDNEPLGDRLDGSSFAADPGVHVFRFEARGIAPTEQSLVISEGQKDRREAIVLSTPPAVRVGPTAAPVPAPASADAAASATSRGAGQRWVGITVGAVGLVGLGLGAVFGGLAASDWSQAKSYCDGKPLSCTTAPSSPGVRDKDAATTLASLSTVSFIAAGALVATGLVVFFTAPKSRPADRRAASLLQLVPSVGPQGAGLLLRGQFGQ